MHEYIHGFLLILIFIEEILHKDNGWFSKTLSICMLYNISWRPIEAYSAYLKVMHEITLNILQFGEFEMFFGVQDPSLFLFDTFFLQLWNSKKPKYLSFLRDATKKSPGGGPLINNKKNLQGYGEDMEVKIPQIKNTGLKSIPISFKTVQQFKQDLTKDQYSLG